MKENSLTDKILGIFLKQVRKELGPHLKEVNLFAVRPAPGALAAVEQLPLAAPAAGSRLVPIRVHQRGWRSGLTAAPRFARR